MHVDCWRKGGKDSYLSWVMLMVGVELNSSGSGSKSRRRPVLKEEIGSWEVAAGLEGVRTRSMNWTGDKGFGLNSRGEGLPD